MYNNNKLRNHYSLSQKRIIPISNPIFPTNNHLNNYYNNYFDSFSSKNNINRKYDVSEINQIIENCRNNLKRLQNTYIQFNNASPSKYNTQKDNNLIINDYNNKNIKNNRNNLMRRHSKSHKNIHISLMHLTNDIINKKKKNYNIDNKINYNINDEKEYDIDNYNIDSKNNFIDNKNYNIDDNNNIYNNHDDNYNIDNSSYYLNLNNINKNQPFPQNKYRPSLSRNKNLNKKNDNFYSDYFSKESTLNKFNNNKINYLGLSSNRNYYNKNKHDIKSYNTLNYSKMSQNSKINNYFSKEKKNINVCSIENEQYNKNYLKLLNSVEKLKSTVNNYQKTNLELKQQIQQLNNKLTILSNREQYNNLKNNNNISDKDIKSDDEIEKVKDNYYIKKKVNSFKGKSFINYDEKNNLDNNNNYNSMIQRNTSQNNFRTNLDSKYNLIIKKEEIKNDNYNYNNDIIIDNVCKKTLKLNKLIKKNKAKNIIKRNLSKNFNTPNSSRIKSNFTLYNDNIGNSINSNNNNYDNNNNSNLGINNNSNNNINGGIKINNNELINKKISIKNINNEFTKKINYNINNKDKDKDKINNNINNNNNLKKVEIIKKKVSLKKQITDHKKNNHGTISTNSLDINEICKINDNNKIIDVSNINQSYFQKNEIIIDLSRISSDRTYRNKIRNKSVPNIVNNYIYKKKKKERKSFSFMKKSNKLYNSESNKIGIIKLSLNINKLKISPFNCKINKKENTKTNHIEEAIKSIDSINMNNDNKNKILQKLIHNNSKHNSINIIENNNIYLFGVDNKNNLIQFDITMKQYSIFKINQIKDLSSTFSIDYNYNSCAILNALNGLYILTGKNTNILYFYNSQTKFISKICTFIYSHKYGSLLLDIKKNRIFALSGKNLNKCEYYSFINKKLIEIGDLNIDRSYASYTISNNKILCFFGYSYNKNKYINNIEIIDYEKLDKWDINYLNFKLDFNIERSANIIYKNDNNKIYLYIEGKINKQNIVKRILYLYDIRRNEFIKINNLFIEKFIEKKCIWINTNDEEMEKFYNEYFFGKNSNFLELPKEMNNNYFDNSFDNVAVILDDKNNTHFFYKNKLKFEVYSKFL